MNITSILKGFETSGKQHGFGQKEISRGANKFIDLSVRNLSTGIVEESRNGSQIHYDVYTRLLKDRIIFMGHAIGDDVVNIAIAQMLFLEMDKPSDDIKLYVNSPGGSVIAGNALVDTMNIIKPDVSTVAMGMAASMGAIILTSGHPGKRFALANAEIMVHQPLGGVEGQYSDMEIGMAHMKRLRKGLYEVLSKTSGKSFEYIEKICDRNYWMTPAEAKEEGFIDAIL